MDLTIVVATFGDPWWTQLAHTRALPSARAQGVPVVYQHGTTLHGARNAGLAQVTTPWVVHLDADDQLHPGYVRALGEAAARHPADLYAPAVAYVHGGRPTLPQMPKVFAHRHPHGCTTGCLRDGNWLVVGTAARTRLLQEVGGWRDWDWSEDWDLWLRCHLAGAQVHPAPTAVYQAHVRAGSRNRVATRAQKLAVHRAIEAANGLVPA